jgi:cysteine-rich repeat protein
MLGPRCGDGVLQTEEREVCDLKDLNETNPYGKGKCNKRCQPAPFCGDKRVDLAFAEKCDDGVNSGQAGSCKTDCSDFVALPTCGDAKLQSNEQCDDGSAVNGTAGSKCDAHCHTKCGNGTTETGEDCDDGVNNGSYGTCRSDCKLADYCGDNIKNGNEQCDKGMENSDTAYGLNKCTARCKVAPFCGDGRIQPEFNEACDGGSECDATCRKRIIN